MVSTLIFSVGMAIYKMKQRNLAGHVQWMMTSIFFVLSPGLARLLGIAAVVANQGSHTFGSFRYASCWLLMATYASYLFVVPIGNNEAIRSILSVIFK